MSAPPPAESPGPNGSSNPRTTAVAIGIGVATGAALILWGRLFPPDVPKPEPVAAAPAAGPAAAPQLVDGPSKYALCEEVHDVLIRAKIAHGCAGDKWPLIKGVCEIALQTKVGCERQLNTAAACAKAAPQTGWVCNANGEVELIACADEAAALDKCLNL